MSELEKENLEEIVILRRQPDEDGREIVNFTTKAITALKEASESEKVHPSIRLYVQGGGCSGFTYGLEFEDQGKHADRVFEKEGITIYIDPISAMHLEGVKIDYVMGISGAGFKFENPYATIQCGCGSSFS